ncbi:MAG: cell division protein ZapA [Anaerococcus obesiensis]
MADNKIVVNIAGMDYTLISDQDENQIEQIADYVDKKIREIDNDKLTRENQLVLASLNIADEMYKLLIKHKNLRKEAEEPIENYPKIKEAYEDLEEENQLIKDDFEKSKKDFMESMKKSMN